jgi:hypothetical protein
MDLFIYKKDTDTLVYTVKDCIKTGNSYFGSNMKLTGLKKKHWDFVWMVDSETPALIFMGTYVGSKEDVNNVTKKEIKKQYSIEDEIKILREHIFKGNLSNEYNDFVKGILDKGKTCKNHFKGEQ